MAELPSQRGVSQARREHMSTLTVFKVGDKVTFAPDMPIKPSLVGQVFLIEAVPNGRRKTYYIRQADGVARYRARPNEIVPATPENLSAPFEPRPFQPIEFFDVGQIVTVTSSSGKVAKDQ